MGPTRKEINRWRRLAARRNFDGQMCPGNDLQLGSRRFRWSVIVILFVTIQVYRVVTKMWIKIIRHDYNDNDWSYEEEVDLSIGVANHFYPFVW